MTAILPTIPRYVFAYFEPVSLIVGFIGAVANPSWFITEQIPFSKPENPSINSTAVALQLGNIYLLLAMIGYVTSDT